MEAEETPLQSSNDVGSQQETEVVTVTETESLIRRTHSQSSESGMKLK